MRKRNDILWKSILEGVFDDLLRFVFPEADATFDWGRGFEFLDKELDEITPLPEKGSGIRFVDKLVKAYKRDGKLEWILVHIEVQESAANADRFPERMFEYYYYV